MGIGENDLEQLSMDAQTSNDVSHRDDHLKERPEPVRGVDEGVEGHQVPEADGGQADEAEVERGPERPTLGAGEESGPQEEDEDDEDDADHDGNVDLFEQGKGGSEVSFNALRSGGCGFKPRCH